MNLMDQNFLALVFIVLLIALSAFFLFYIKRLRKKIRLIGDEREKDRMNFETMVKERTHTLEKIRDSVSEYAVQKSELAQELDAKNIEILKQRDNLFKQSDKLKDAYDEIKKLEAYRQQMTRMIIHDLKNPLNLIINIAESDDIPAKSGKLITKLSWGMLDLIVNILEVNKLEKMRMKIVMTSFCLESTINKLLEKFTYILSSSSVTLLSNISGDIRIFGDIQITERIFDNLISNAIKYSSAGGIINISASDDDEYVRIEVRDNGAGIPKNIMNEVFVEYTHGENRSFTYSNPTGIGLAYCKLAVEAMNGKIGIISEHGKGTIVWFTLKKDTASFSEVVQETIPPGTELKSPQLFSEMSTKEIDRFESLISSLSEAEIDEVSSIMRILDTYEPDDSGKYNLWKDRVLEAAYKGDVNAFRSLLNMLSEFRESGLKNK